MFSPFFILNTHVSSFFPAKTLTFFVYFVRSGRGKAGTTLTLHLPPYLYLLCYIVLLLWEVDFRYHVLFGYVHLINVFVETFQVISTHNRNLFHGSLGKPRFDHTPNRTKDERCVDDCDLVRACVRAWYSRVSLFHISIMSLKSQEYHSYRSLIIASRKSLEKATLECNDE